MAAVNHCAYPFRAKGSEGRSNERAELFLICMLTPLRDSTSVKKNTLIFLPFFLHCQSTLCNITLQNAHTPTDKFCYISKNTQRCYQQLNNIGVQVAHFPWESCNQVSKKLKTFHLFQTLPVHTWLSDTGFGMILQSSHDTTTLLEITN